MVAFSKQLDAKDFTCYDIIHPWETQCKRVCFGFGVSTFKNSLKVYIPLYLLSSLIQGKLFKPEKWPTIAMDIIRSSCFLSWNGTAFMTSVCLLRWILKNFYPWSVAFVPAFFASFTALQFERPVRRKALTVYMLNTMSQMFYTIAKNNGLIRPIPNGEVLIFSLTMSIFLYLYKKRIQTRDLTTVILRFFIGTSEGGSPLTTMQRKKSFEKQKLIMQLVPPIIPEKLASVEFGPKHICCTHEKGCAYYCTTGLLRSFFIGYAAKVLLKTLSSLKIVVEYPIVLLQYLLSSQNLKFGLFLGFFTFLCRFVNCLLRWMRNEDEPINGLISGFVAGWSMLLFPAPGISSYSFWKMIELLCNIGVKNGHIPALPFAGNVLYAFLTASMFHLSLFQPDVLQESYWRFLVNLTDQKFLLINRPMLEVWGISPNKRFKTAINPDPHHSSDSMKKYLQQLSHNSITD